MTYTYSFSVGGAVRASLLAFGLSAAAVASAFAQDTRTITDMDGRSVEVPAKIERIATVGPVPVLNSFVFAVGEGDKIVNGIPGAGASGYWANKILSPHLLEAPQLQTSNGSEPDIEALLTLKPDIAFTSSKQVAEAVERAGIPVVMLKLTTGDEIRDSVGVTGEALGREDEAAAYQQYFQDVEDRVTKVAATIPADAQPTVLYLNLQPLRRPNLIMDWMLNLVGANSVTKDVTVGQFQFNVEQVQAWDPEMIIGMRPDDREGLTTQEQFSGLQAVKNGKIGIVPTGIQTWGNTTTEQPLALLWVAKYVHPEAFADIDLVAETRDFYAKYFKIEVSEEDVRKILLMD